MSVRILIDMNLSPEWVDLLAAHGWSAIHWSHIAQHDAADSSIMAYARDHARVVFTHDLDFSTLLALTHAAGPSVVQVRTQNVLPEHLGPLVFAALRQHELALLAGAIVVVDERRSRVRVLPL